MSQEQIIENCNLAPPLRNTASQVNIAVAEFTTSASSVDLSAALTHAKQGRILTLIANQNVYIRLDEATGGALTFTGAAAAAEKCIPWPAFTPFPFYLCGGNVWLCIKGITAAGQVAVYASSFGVGGASDLLGPRP